MRLTRISSVVLLVLMVMLTSGCMKTWSIDFTNNNGGWSTLIGWVNPGITASGDYGLLLSGSTLRANYGFSGDIEYIVKFKLNVDTLNTLTKMEIYLGEGWDPPQHFIKCVFENIGGSSEYYAIFDNGSMVHNAIYVNGIVHAGINEFRMTIVDGVANFFVNDVSMYMPYTIENYVNPFLVPYIFVQQGSPEENEELVLFKSLTVQYSGDRQNITEP